VIVLLSSVSLTVQHRMQAVREQEMFKRRLYKVFLIIIKEICDISEKDRRSHVQCCVCCNWCSRGY
jgi:hypothetical protein